MFWRMSKPKVVTATINDLTITVEPKETLLQAALRQGVDFPFSCRVGGCATCKCRLLDGQVKELTRSDYILSDVELDQGYILACQSVPRSDIRIAVALGDGPALRSLSGRVLACEQLTHDIIELRIQLEDSLRYRPGQFAELSLQSLPGLSRSYSFATAVRPDAQVSFFVRQVPGGVFSTHVHKQAMVGDRVTVAGPLGDFWLRPADAPLLLVAGGSGLAPILALLEHALARGVARPVTLLFGARGQRDLYALKAIRALAADWPARFEFVPVLSDEPDDSDWSGARGFVTAHMGERMTPDCHAYLCGPPPMIDSAQTLLLAHGVARAHIHADRFTTQHDLPATA